MEKRKGLRKSQKGSALLMVTIFLLILTLITGTCLMIASMQYDQAILSRNTNHTYALARSAIEKYIDTMNKSLEIEMTHIVKGLSATYIEDLIGEKSHIKYDGLSLRVDQTILLDTLKESVYQYLKSNFIENPITYSVQGDRVSDDYITTISVSLSERDSNNHQLVDQLRVIAKAITKSSVNSAVYDTQKLEAMIHLEIPEHFSNQIHEKYAFQDLEVPDSLRSPLLCFSDVVVSNGGKLVVTSGDVRVGGKQNISNYGTKEVPLYAEANQHGGVIAVNGGAIELKNGSLYCINNVLATNGWGAPTYTKTSQITVDKDVVAYTIGIVDDYYKNSTNQSPFNTKHQVSGAHIHIKRNAMVDNDVMIGRWVNGCEINVDGTIFGVNGGSDFNMDSSMMQNIDPNQSSSVFSQGIGTKITADRMFIAGQSYITVQEGLKPLKLWESIGEPFDGVASYEGYQVRENKEKAANKGYLNVFSSLIQGDKIETDFSQTYAIETVSGRDTSDFNIMKVGEECKAIFGNNQVKAVSFFYKGGYLEQDFSAFMKDGKSMYHREYTQKVQDVMENIEAYYRGEKRGYQRNIEGSGVPTSNYRGLRGYMTLMRSIFYKGFRSEMPERATFNDVIRTSEDSLPKSNLEGNQASWSYATPICVTDGGDIDISQFYVDEGTGLKPYPSMIISHNGLESKTLKLRASDAKHHTFKGIIISKGPVEIESDLKIEGVLIIGGAEDMPDLALGDRREIFKGKYAGLKLVDHTLELTYDAEVLTQIAVKDHAIFRQVLDALQLTNYKEKTALKDIMDRQVLNRKKLLRYTNQSTLEIDTQGIHMKIGAIKKIK